MNTIYINGRFLTQPITGVQRVAHEALKALDNLIDRGKIDRNQYSFILMAPKKGLLHNPSLKHISIETTGSLRGHIWEQLELPLRIKGHPLICLCNSAPIIKRRQAVIIHDAAVFGFPSGFSMTFRTWYKIMLTFVGKRADNIITVSNFSKGELIKYCSIDECKITVISEGKEHFLSIKPDYAVLEKNKLQKKGYILAVSSLNPNKNFYAIMKAVEQLKGEKIQAVIAGGTNPRVFSGTGNAISDQVKYVGYVSDNELKALYENAACFVFPSFYEGFGLPPLEAMACGCPVIVSNTASLPELCRDAALYCDPARPADLAEKIKLIIHNTALQDELTQKGFSRAACFSWENCAESLFKVVRDSILD